VPPLAENQTIIRPLDNPIHPRGHIQILRGSLAPEGAVGKITGKEGTAFSGPANVFDSEEAMLAALEKKQIHRGDVVVIRYEGPQGGPGMPEMLTPTSAIMGAGLGSDVALLTDGRFSGRLPWLYRGAHRAGSPGGRTHCADSQWRCDHHRCGAKPHRRPGQRRRYGVPPPGMVGTALQSHPGRTLQVYQNCDIGLGRVCDRCLMNKVEIAALKVADATRIVGCFQSGRCRPRTPGFAQYRPVPAVSFVFDPGVDREFEHMVGSGHGRLPSGTVDRRWPPGPDGVSPDQIWHPLRLRPTRWSAGRF
jgi:hypothetical protein